MIIYYFQLESFLKMRLYETNAANESQTFSLIEQLPTESESALAALLSAVQSASSAITAAEITHLHNVKHSPRFVYTQLVEPDISRLRAIADRERECLRRHVVCCANCFLNFNS